MRFFSAATRRCCASSRGFTLFEIMIVVAIMGIVMAMGVPIVFKVRHREALNQSVRDVVEVLNNVRAQAIMQGKMAELILHPRERRIEINGGTPALQAKTTPDSDSPGAEGPAPDSGLVAQIPDSVSVEMMDVNLVEYKDRELGRVRFHPNGTSDEFTLVLRSDRGEWIKIWLEATTGLANVGPVDAR